MDLKKVTLDNFEIHICEYEKKKSAGITYFVEFLTSEGNECSEELTTCLNKNVNRLDSVHKLNMLIKNINISFLVEAGIYEFSLMYIMMNNILEDLLITVYADVLNDILLNLDKTSYIKNKTLLDRLLNSDFMPQYIAFMNPQELYPERWEDNTRKKKIKEYKKNNMAATDMYKCKCGARRCTVSQLQTRSSDEPLTTFITCLVCKNTFKM